MSSFLPYTFEQYKAALAQEQKGKHSWESITRKSVSGIVVPPLYATDQDSGAGLQPTLQPRIAARPIISTLLPSVPSPAVIDDLKLLGYEEVRVAVESETALTHLAQAHIKFVHIIAADEEQAGRLASDTNRGFGKISSFDPYNSLLCGRRAGSGFAPNSKRALAAGLNAHYYLSGAVSQVSDNPALQLGWHFAVVRDLLKASTTQLRIEVEYTLGSDMFANIAAIRALRFGLQQLLPPASFSIVTTPNRLHYLDEKPESNLIRSAYMQLSALLGGADCCLAGGYSSSAPEATPNLDELRLAANQIHLLLEECHIGAVADPVSGSPFFDQYTTLLLAEANRFLAEIEAQGSITECLRTNSVQKRVLQSQIELHQRLSSGNKVVVGLNKYRWAEHKPARIADYQARLINEAYAPLNPLTVQQLAAESLSEYANARSN